MYLSALFNFLLTPYYFPGIVFPLILQPCLLDSCFLPLAPLSSVITLLPWVKEKKPHLLLKARIREFLCLQENKTTKTQCSGDFQYKPPKTGNLPVCISSYFHRQPHNQPALQVSFSIVFISCPFVKTKA